MSSEEVQSKLVEVRILPNGAAIQTNRRATIRDTDLAYCEIYCRLVFDEKVYTEVVTCHPDVLEPTLEFLERKWEDTERVVSESTRREEGEGE